MTKQSEKNLRLTFWGKWKRMITFLIAFVLAMKQLFVCLESLTNNARIWGSENPQVTRELQRDSGKVNVWCGLLCNKVIGPFFFQQKTITADIYLQTLTEYVAPQLEEFQPHSLFQQDEAPPHWGKKVREFLDQKFSNRWIGRGGPIFWPPRSPDITPLDFFLWGFVKDIVYRTKVKLSLIHI